MTADSALNVEARRKTPLSPRPHLRIVDMAAVLLLGGALLLAGSFAWRWSAFYLLGAFLGLVLYHATFGFASSWRSFGK